MLLYGFFYDIYSHRNLTKTICYGFENRIYLDLVTILSTIFEVDQRDYLKIDPF